MAWFILLAGLAIVLISRGPDLLRIPGTMLSPTSRTAFDSWLNEDPARAEGHAALLEYLTAQGVSDVVPVWQLTRIDGHYARRCDLPVFRIPPRELWPNIVPALRLVRDEVKPRVGEVEVLSSYRTPDLNTCARGASRSNHLDFSALDLRTVDGKSGPDFYQRLCAMQDAAGPGSRMGLGAYYDASRPNYAGGRFHIDAEGFRSWGRSYTAASSPCR
ncbi:D-Ala-D-Ala carboxypeptidase family metallohydrolase [Erythrobacter litoralis]|uniref:Uncharacterized protein n=1 Tax=Erythrobacter litoralis (strain HTCC2594) TaxID=314225 RepID=Q2N8W8_ERYLH|nr:D-Ala-D-Ala carboxypeptidase family metallohydrolase [Erythrobacter litoralis]ABC63873.1 hypothetical protein ELI_08905 [Erythrobacter litoralis HTCC2594]